MRLINSILLRNIITVVNKRCYFSNHVLNGKQYLSIQNKYHKVVRQSNNHLNFRNCSNTAFEHNPESTTKTEVLGKIKPQLFLAFTCKMCNARVEKKVSKTAYTKGVVIVRCDGCEENHLIADNLGWFPNLKSMRNIEDIMEAQGEVVKKRADNFTIKEE